jgi:cytochrome b pre-mRNA-processing protein 3
MLKALFSKSPEKRAGESLFAHVVSAGRRPVFYAEKGVPDTLDGRFELIVLHAALVMRRLRDGDALGREIGQQLFDAMFRDFAAALREMGTGDSKVGKNVKTMGEAFYGRARAYDEALNAGDDAALAQAIERNVFRADEDAEPSAAAAALAAYVGKAVAALAEQPLQPLIDGEAPDFPEP